MMKAINTKYSGRLFRSRLEARWAVYFNEMCIKWEYEKEGFELPNGIGYLPDFWLPESQCWLEVKPGKFSREEHMKCVFLQEGTGFSVIMADGLPDTKTYYRIGGHAIYMFYHKGEIGNWEIGCNADERDYQYLQWQLACDKANSARFEFGESGAVL